MEIILGIVIAIGGLLLVMSLRLITTFFHEMGHAIPALIFTDDKVEVYVGSYGDISKSLKLAIGRLHLILKWNIFEWQIGLCRSKQILDSTWKRIIIVLGGPIASLLISIPLIMNLQRLQTNSLIFFMSVVFIGAAILDLAINLYPSASAMNMHDGGVAYSDGFVLKSLITRSFREAEYFTLEDLYEKKDYETLEQKAETLIASGNKKKYIFQFLINSCIKQKDDVKALASFKLFEQNHKLDHSDFFELGKIHQRLSNNQEALKYFDLCYHINYRDPELLNEISNVHSNLGNHEEAITYLTRATYSSPDYALSYKNRAMVYIKIGLYNEAKVDIDIADKHLENDPELCYIQGLYFEKTYNKPKALDCYLNAKALDSQQHGLDYKIEMMRN